MIKECIQQLCELSENIDNSKSVQVPQAMSPGDMLPQGDIGLLMLSEKEITNQWKEIPWPNTDLQLAPGNTKGSRHIIPSKFKNVVKVFRINDNDPLSDLGLQTSGPFDLLHPEHANHIGYPVGVYRVRHQQNEQRMRVLD